MAKVDFRSLYATYNRYYKQTAVKSPVTMTQKLTTKEFKNYYNSIKNARLEEIKEGTRKTTGAIIRDIVAGQQEFVTTSKQAKKMYEAAKIAKLDFKMKDFRLDPNKVKEFGKKIREQRDLLIKNGYSKTDANELVSEYFFGS